MRNRETAAVFGLEARGISGFTLVEIMIVVGIIGLLAMIAIPSFAKARLSARRACCINNLRQMDSAREQYAISSGISKITCYPSFEAGVIEYIKGGRPQCPSGGTYSYGTFSWGPSCSVDEHCLPEFQ